MLTEVNRDRATNQLVVIAFEQVDNPTRKRRIAGEQNSQRQPDIILK